MEIVSEFSEFRALSSETEITHIVRFEMHVEIIIQGVVQGVGYRFFTIQKAREYGITGYVENLPDGSVLVVAEGKKGILQDFIKELRIGPPSARVTKVDVKFSRTEKGYKNFSVKF